MRTAEANSSSPSATVPAPVSPAIPPQRSPIAAATASSLSPAAAETAQGSSSCLNNFFKTLGQCLRSLFYFLTCFGCFGLFSRAEEPAPASEPVDPFANHPIRLVMRDLTSYQEGYQRHRRHIDTFPQRQTLLGSRQAIEGLRSAVSDTQSESYVRHTQNIYSHTARYIELAQGSTVSLQTYKELIRRALDLLPTAETIERRRQQRLTNPLTVDTHSESYTVAGLEYGLTTFIWQHIRSLKERSETFKDELQGALDGTSAQDPGRAALAREFQKVNECLAFAIEANGSLLLRGPSF